MLNTNYQHQLLEYHKLKLELQDADVIYFPDFLDAKLATIWFDGLIKEIQWKQETIRLYGKQHQTPRLSCWMADTGLDYRYSNMTMQPVEWNKTVLRIKQILEDSLEYSFNSVLLNYYRSGQDSNAWHSDDERELGHNPRIASISLGAARDFQLRNKKDKKLSQSISLEHASLLLMQGVTQSYWQHQIPKRANTGPRINLTFRSIQKNR